MTEMIQAVAMVCEDDLESLLARLLRGSRTVTDMTEIYQEQKKKIDIIPLGD